MTDKRQAYIDAINSILASRQMGPVQLPAGGSGNFDLDVDPELDTLDSNIADSPDVEINDPDNVLQQVKNNKQNKKQQSGQSQSNTSSSDNSESDDEDIDDNYDNDSADNGESSNSSDADDETEQQSSSSKSNDSDSQEGSSGSDSGDEGDEDIADNYGESKLDPEYIQAWNEIVTRYGLGTANENEIRQLIADIKSGKITSI